MNQAQTATINYWKRTQPALFKQAAKGVPGFGQTDTFDSIMGNLNSLLTSYGQYKIASDVATSQANANRNVTALPGSGTGVSRNWLMIGGIGLIAVVAAVLLFRRKR